MANPKFTLRQLFTLTTWIAVVLGVLGAQYYWHTEHERLRRHIQDLGVSLERSTPEIVRPYPIFGRLTESEVAQIETELSNLKQFGEIYAGDPIVLMRWNMRGPELYEVEVLTEGATTTGNLGRRYAFGMRNGQWALTTAGEWNDEFLDPRERRAIQEHRHKSSAPDVE